MILNKLSTVNKDPIGETQTTIGQSTATTVSDVHQPMRAAQGSALQLTPMSNPVMPGMMTTQTAHNLMQQLQTLQFLLSQQIAKENLQTQLSIDSIGHNHTYPYHHSINNSIGNGNNYPPNLVRSASVQPQIDVLPIQRQRRLSVDNSPFKKVPIQHHLNRNNHNSDSPHRRNSQNNKNQNGDIDNQLIPMGFDAMQFMEYLELQRRKSSQNLHEQQQQKQHKHKQHECTFMCT